MHTCLGWPILSHVYFLIVCAYFKWMNEWMGIFTPIFNRVILLKILLFSCANWYSCVLTAYMFLSSSGAIRPLPSLPCAPWEISTWVWRPASWLSGTSEDWKCLSISWRQTKLNARWAFMWNCTENIFGNESNANQGSKNGIQSGKGRTK